MAITSSQNVLELQTLCSKELHDQAVLLKQAKRLFYISLVLGHGAADNISRHGFGLPHMLEESRFPGCILKTTI